MKLKSENPAYGLSISYEGNRYTCEAGGFVEVDNVTGRGILKTKRGVVEAEEIKVPPPAAPKPKRGAKKSPAKEEK